MLLATAASLLAVLVFDAPLHWKLAVGAVVAANPLAVRAAWFGVADAPSILFLVLAFALLSRSRHTSAAACLALSVLFKQFALIAIPFFAAMLVTQGVARQTLVRAAATFGGVIAVCFIPFAVADFGALWEDTVAYGTSTYRIIGYGLSGVLVELGIVERTGSYPFIWLALFVWAPLTVYLVLSQLRSRALWVGAVGFAISVFVLLYLSRVLQNSYLVWPLVGIALAVLLAVGPRHVSRTDA